MQQNLRKLPQPGEVWQHYKGGEYEIICLAERESDGKQDVVYKSIHDQRIWSRNIHVFMSKEKVLQSGGKIELIDRFVKIADVKEEPLQSAYIINAEDIDKLDDLPVPGYMQEPDEIRMPFSVYRMMYYSIHPEIAKEPYFEHFEEPQKATLHEQETILSADHVKIFVEAMNKLSEAASMIRFPEIKIPEIKIEIPEINAEKLARALDEHIRKAFENTSNKPKG